MTGDDLSRSRASAQRIVLREKAGFGATPANAAKVMASAKANAKAMAGLLMPAFVENAVIKFKPPAPPALGRIGPLEVRLASKKADVKRAQRLRYKVFYKDGTAIADAATMLAQRDKDGFDKICDHLLVIDHAAKPSLSGKQPVVGTYRLLRQDVAQDHGGFYTDHEFAISELVERHPISNSWSSAAPACCRRIATSARWSCCGTASGATCAGTAAT